MSPRHYTIAELEWDRPINTEISVLELYDGETADLPGDTGKTIEGPCRLEYTRYADGEIVVQVYGSTSTTPTA